MRIIITEKKLAALGACDKAIAQFAARHKRLDISRINVYDPANRWLHEYYGWCCTLITYVTRRDAWNAKVNDVCDRYFALTPYVQTEAQGTELYRDYCLVRLGMLIEFVLELAADPTQHHKLAPELLPRKRRSKEAL